MDARDLLKKVVDKEREFRQQDFLAPYTERSKTAVIKMDKVNYKFRIVGFKDSGFGVFHPIDPSCARFIKPALFEDVRAYLEILPKIHLILAYETEEGWVSYPMSRHSAAQSLGLQSEVIVRNVSDCERFDVVVVRYDGLHFWYDEPFASADLQQAEEMRECFNCDESTTPAQMRSSLSYVKGLSPEQQHSFDLALQSWVTFKNLTAEDRLRESLLSGGGKLKSYVVRGKQLDVKWTTDSGREYRSILNKESLDVVSAGICLSGGDRNFHLKDLPFLMNMAEATGGPTVTNLHLNMDDDGEVTDESMRYYGYDWR